MWNLSLTGFIACLLIISNPANRDGYEKIAIDNPTRQTINSLTCQLSRCLQKTFNKMVHIETSGLAVSSVYIGIKAGIGCQE